MPDQRAGSIHQTTPASRGKKLLAKDEFGVAVVTSLRSTSILLIRTSCTAPQLKSTSQLTELRPSLDSKAHRAATTITRCGSILRIPGLCCWPWIKEQWIR